MSRHYLTGILLKIHSLLKQKKHNYNGEKNVNKYSRIQQAGCPSLDGLG